MPENTFKIYFFGDSICFGQHVSLHKGWVPRLSQTLSEAFDEEDREVAVTNTSIAGSTTRQALERMPYDVQNHRPHILIVQYGLNDCNYWASDGGHPRVSPRAFSANLNEMVDRAFTFGTQKVILNTNHATTRNQSPMTNTTLTFEDSNRQYNALIREVAREWDDRVVLNDMEREFLRYTGNSREALLDLLLEDQIHLSKKGHDLYYQMLAPLVKQAVNELLASYV